MSEISEDGHIEEPGNIHYPGLGRPCPKCKKVFVSCDDDLKGHLTVCKGSGLNSLEWRKSDFDDGEFCSVTQDPQLLYTLEHQSSKVQVLGYEYFLSKNKKWIKRRRVSFF